MWSGARNSSLCKKKIRDVDEVGSGCMYQSVIDSAVRVTMALSDKDMHESKTRTF